MSEQREGPAQVSNTREPYVHPGGKPEPGSGIEMPPYDNRQTDGKSEAELTAERGGPGTSDAPPRASSQAEREGVSLDTNTDAASPMGVGESINKQGNEQALNKSTAAKEADQKDIGVGGASPNLDPEMPEAISGNQGG